MNGPLIALVGMIAVALILAFGGWLASGPSPSEVGSIVPPPVAPAQKCYHEWRQLVPVESGGEVVAYLCATTLDGCDLQLETDSSEAKHYRRCESIANGWRAGVEQFDENGYSKGGLVR